MSHCRLSSLLPRRPLSEHAAQKLLRTGGCLSLYDTGLDRTANKASRLTAAAALAAEGKAAGPSLLPAFFAPCAGQLCELGSQLGRV